VDYKALEKQLLELIRRSSTDLPPDVEKALRAAYRREEPGSPAKTAFKTMLSSMTMSRKESLPLCQDTGTLVWYIHYPDGEETLPVIKAIENAIAKATEMVYLRPNAVDSITNKNSGNNLGAGSPNLHLEAWNKKEWEFRILHKGGGCENCGNQFKLPDATLSAGRDLEGVYRAILAGTWCAQGQGCAPGVILACIGGGRDNGMAEAKKQGFRKLDDVNPVPELAKLEKRLVTDINKLGIGPMGLGGKTTVLGVKIGALHRLPASYFVSISYMCWSDRRCKLTIKGKKATYEI
jgi:fumarate hydratase, class I